LTGISTHGLTGSLQNSVLAGQALARADRHRPAGLDDHAPLLAHPGRQIGQFRGSEDTQQTARVLTPALTPTGNP
jgi:hypothetical protein